MYFHTCGDALALLVLAPLPSLTVKTAMANMTALKLKTMGSVHAAINTPDSDIPMTIMPVNMGVIVPPTLPMKAASVF